MKKWILGLGGGLLSILLLSHSFIAEEPLSVDDTFEEKSYAITELVESNLEPGINALAMEGVDNVEDIIIDNNSVVFDWCKMTGILDGSGALDSTTGNGYDSSLNNKVVRTHDSVTYQINLGLQLTEEANENVYRSGELNVRFTLPVTSDKARFDTRSLAFFKDYNIQNVGGSQVLTGKFVLPTNSQGFAIPCATRCDVTIAVKDMQNGSRLQPTFEFSSKSTTWEHMVVPDPVTVTCRTYYELSAGARTVNQLTTRKDYTGTNRANTWLALYDITVKPKTSKVDSGEIIKEKGVFFPDKLQFTIDISSYREDTKTAINSWLCDYSFNGGNGVHGNSLVNSTFPLWDSSMNISNGQVSVSGKRLTVTLSGYGEMGGTFRVGVIATCPTTDYFYTVKLDCRNLQALNGSTWESVIEGEDYSKSSSVRNFPVGGYTQYFAVSSRCNTSNRHSMFLLQDGDGGAGNKAHHLNSDLRECQDSVLSRDQEITLSAATVLNQGYEPYNHMMSLNTYCIWDTNCFELDESKERIHSAYEKLGNWSAGSSRILYIAKANGTGFSGNSEMASFNETTANNYRYYTSLSALKASGAVCVGVVQELRNFFSNNTSYRADTWIQIDVPVKVKTNCVTNKAYCFTGGFIANINQTLGSHSSGAVGGLTASDLKIFDMDIYSPTRFNTDGTVISQGSDIRWANTVYVKSAKATIAIEVANKIGSTTKDTYNYSNDEKYVWFKITPGHFGVINNETWTYTINVPKGLDLPLSLPSNDLAGDAYLKWGGTFTQSEAFPSGGSVLGGETIRPSLIRSTNGSLDLVFTKNLRSTSDFQPMYLCLAINGNQAQNGQNYVVSARVTGDSAIKVSKLHRNYDETGINVILNTSVSVAKTGLEKVQLTENGVNLLYSITIKNTGATIENFDFRELTPGAFSRTTSDSKYKINGYVITTPHATGLQLYVKLKGMTSTNPLDWENNALSYAWKEFEEFALVGTLEAGELLTVDINIGAPDAIMGDIFWNRYQFRAPALGNEWAYSNWVKTVVPIVEADLTINKNISRNTFVTAKGSPTFHYKITSIDDKAEPVTYYKSITIPEGQYKGSVSFKVPGRVYKIEELPTNDWSLVSKAPGSLSYLLNPVSNWKQVGLTQSVPWTGTQELYAVLNKGGHAQVTFTNNGSFKDYTENDEEINRLK